MMHYEYLDSSSKPSSMSNKSIIFIPDISGFTKFVQSTEAEHSQHVISELLEILIGANTQKLVLAEIEGDALFFYKEEIPSMEKLLAQVETMFTAFYSHLKLLENNRICPCNACALAPNLELKIIVHCGHLQFLAVQGKRKPFGNHVIEAHRLLKNSVDSDNYVLFSNQLMEDIMLPKTYESKLFTFQEGEDHYDGKTLPYSYAHIDNKNLKIKPFEQAKLVNFTRKPNAIIEQVVKVSANTFLEYVTNYKYRQEWFKGVNRFEYNEQEVTRVGTEHVCVINGKHFNFVTVTKAADPEQLVYGELTTDPPMVDELYQFYLITPLSNHTCNVEIQLYWVTKSILKTLAMTLFFKRIFIKNNKDAIKRLYHFIENHQTKVSESLS